MIARATSWFKGHLPTRESIAVNRWTRPFARHLLRPDLWHFNRRSVPRAVAIGLFIAPVVPVAHTFVAALFAVPTRANIIIAAGITWLINPFTIPFFYYSAYHIGTWVLRIDTVSPALTHAATKQATSWLTWLFDKSGPVAVGTLILATGIAAIGYFASSFVWRLWIGRKWQRRRWRARLHG